jgi:ATP-binding cassette subfamily B protein
MADRFHSDISILKRLLREARKYWPHISGIFVLDLLATPLALLSPLPLKLAVDNVLGSEPLPRFLGGILPEWIRDSPMPLLVFAACMLVAVSALSQLQKLGSSYFRTYVGGKITMDFKSRLFWHGQRLSLAYHDSKGVTHALYRIQYDSSAVRWVAIDGLIPMLSAFVALISMLCVIALINVQLALIAMVVVPVLVILIKRYRQPLRQGWKNQKRLDNAAMTVINEVFSSLRVVKAFTQEGRERARFMHQAEAGLSAQLRVILLQGSFDLMTGIVTAAGTGVVLFFGAQAIQSGIMTIGDLLVVMAYLVLLYSPLQVIGSQLAGMQNAFASADRAYEFLDEQSDVKEAENALPLERARGEFRLADVAFGYTPDIFVFKGVSLVIPAGSRVGIVGRTGAGKTTLLSLLMRFYDTASGEIFLDGVNIRQYRLLDLRQQFGIVLQDPVLFSSTIADNIAYGRTNASTEEIIAAAKTANAHDFIIDLPEGYDTVVGERGMRLSGGERQRIALARAFLRDSPVLLLDEPTSAVDVKTEAGIMQAMERLMQGRTTFMIAHRLSTLGKCDMVLEVKDGRIERLAGNALEALQDQQALQSLGNA